MPSIATVSTTSNIPQDSVVNYVGLNKTMNDRGSSEPAGFDMLATDPRCQIRQQIKELSRAIVVGGDRGLLSGPDRKFLVPISTLKEAPPSVIRSIPP